MSTDPESPQGPNDWLVHWGDRFRAQGDGRSWDDGRRLGFLAGGRGERASQGMRRLRAGDRAWVRPLWNTKELPAPGDTPKPGVAALAIVLADAEPSETATIYVDGRPVAFRDPSLQLQGDYVAAGEGPDLAEYIVPVRFEAFLDESEWLRHDQVRGTQHTVRRLTDPNELQALHTAFGLEPGHEDDRADDDALELAREEAHGQGYAVDTKAIEDVGMREVARHFAGWEVEDVSSSRCGWDLTVTRDKERWLVEVKATTGARPTVLLTANELDKALSEPQWTLAVVTRALAGPDPVRFYSGAEARTAAVSTVSRAALSGAGSSGPVPRAWSDFSASPG